uniref:Uncharacterized protein n=1 Tax=Romanomermis culicivorax TaxID=13658 RepID=A0A915L9A1_ROMCU
MTEGFKVQFSFNSILKRMREDMLASSDQATVVEEYGHQIRKFLQIHKATDMFNLEHFFLGLFITTENTRLYDGPRAMQPEKIKKSEK